MEKKFNAPKSKEKDKKELEKKNKTLSPEP